MKSVSNKVLVLVVAIAASLNSSAFADDAVSGLFNLLDSGGCVPESLTGDVWTITTVNGDTHSEIVVGDALEFIQQQASLGVASTTNFTIERNAIPWTSENSWLGQCVSDGTTSRYVVEGQIDVSGCTHEFAFSRADSSGGEEVIEFFMTEVGCGTRNPGDADGRGNNN